ncbi:MAG: arsenate reductase ArsC [Bacteroidia bacterium]|nr:arsenate reductase ArsC [Bacteroidia bacterium]
MKNILFVCVENSNRSQMAQAYARIFGKNKVNAYSAGSKPSGVVNPKAINAMALENYDLTVHESKGITDLPKNISFDYVVGMGCGDACPIVPTKERLEWDIPDPKSAEGDAFLKIRDVVKKNVQELIEKINREVGKA